MEQSSTTFFRAAGANLPPLPFWEGFSFSSRNFQKDRKPIKYIKEKDLTNSAKNGMISYIFVLKMEMQQRTFPKITETR
ncbi:MAG: hypothetical protein E7680_05375 [Ruminococcaceae bacterium]|nr:hypothetical protein [Oscillospiraceae bacterium]